MPEVSTKPAAGWLRLLPACWRSHIEGRTVLQQLASNAGWLVADKIVRLGIGVIVNIWIARYLGPTDFGLFNYAQAVAILFAAVSTLGLPDIVVRDLVRMTERRAAILASAFALRVAGAVVVIGLSLVTVVFSRPNDVNSWIIVALVAAAQVAQAIDVVDSGYQVVGRVRTIVIIRNFGFIAFSGLKVAAILLHLPLVVFAGLFTAELFAVGVLIYIRARSDGLAFRLRDAERNELRRLLVEAMPLILRLAAIGVYLRIDQVLIGRQLGNAAVGVYSAATGLTQLWYFITTSVMTAVVPRLAQMHGFANDLYEAQLVKVIRFLVTVSVAFAASLTLLAPWIIPLLYGGRYAAAIPVLMIHAWAGVFGTLGQTVSAWFVNARLVRFGFYQALAGAAVNVVLCLLLLPRLGIVGGALAAVASQLVTGFAANVMFGATRRIFWLQMRALRWQR